jgi:hypothetical protein
MGNQNHQYFHISKSQSSHLRCSFLASVPTATSTQIKVLIVRSGKRKNLCSSHLQILEYSLCILRVSCFCWERDHALGEDFWSGRLRLQYLLNLFSFCSKSGTSPTTTLAVRLLIQARSLSDSSIRVYFLTPLVKFQPKFNRFTIH